MSRCRPMTSRLRSCQDDTDGSDRETLTFSWLNVRPWATTADRTARPTVQCRAGVRLDSTSDRLTSSELLIEAQPSASVDPRRAQEAAAAAARIRRSIELDPSTLQIWQRAGRRRAASGGAHGIGWSASRPQPSSRHGAEGGCQLSLAEHEHGICWSQAAAVTRNEARGRTCSTCAAESAVRRRQGDGAAGAAGPWKPRGDALADQAKCASRSRGVRSWQPRRGRASQACGSQNRVGSWLAKEAAKSMRSQMAGERLRHDLRTGFRHAEDIDCCAMKRIGQPLALGQVPF